MRAGRLARAAGYRRASPQEAVPHNNNDGSCIRLRPQHRDHAWSYHFAMDYTSESRAFRRLTIVDEYSRECLAIDVARNLTSEDVLERLSDLFVRRGVPEHIRSDNGSEFTAKRHPLRSRS